MSRIILDAGGLIALDRNDRRVLALLARTATADIVDAHVVVCARRARQAVVTSDAGDLRRIAPELTLLEV
jgi:predicted nucleic acid-binding protein